MKWRVAALLVAVSGAFGPPLVRADALAVQGALRVDGLAAVVGGLAPGEGVISILVSDVELRARLSLLRAGAVEAATGPLPTALLRASLQELVGETLIATEAARLSLSTPTAAELRAERMRLATSVGGEAQLKALASAVGANERELASIVRRRAVVNGFLAANLEGTLAISAAELQRVFETEEHPFRDLAFDQARDRFREWLSQRRLQQAVGRWVESLRARTPHRVLISY